MKTWIALCLLGSLLTIGACIASNHFAYHAPFWLPGGHLQTIAPYLFPPTPTQVYLRERWELDDGDFVDADWTAPASDLTQQPTVVLFHGLEGNSQSHYARTLMAEVKARGWIGVVVHFRGCSGEPNRLPRVYYAGDSQEIDRLLTIIRHKRPHAPLYAVGVSLGGNALLKWLGEHAERAQHLVTAAVAISAPIALKETARSLDSGWNYWLYSKNFVASMKPKALAMAERFPQALDKARIETVKTVQQMDNAVTAVLYGAEHADAYYDLNAAKPWLKNIRTSTLIINAKNDPFVPFSSLPSATEVSDTVTLVYPDHGGHAGFSGTMADSRTPWLAEVVTNFISHNTSNR